MPAAETPADPTFTFHVQPATEAAQQWLAAASPEDLTGDLYRARDLARDLDSSIVLRDAEGFAKGHIEADGDYSLYR